MQILTESGYVDISEIHIGDSVVYFDQKTGEKKLNTIENIEPYTKSMWDERGEEDTFDWYIINGSTKIFKNQSIWAGENVSNGLSIQIGDEIWNDKNEKVLVESIEKIDGTEEDIFYRFTVSGDHSYISDGITFHNASRYWVGGTGNWDTSTTNWSGSSGGGGGSSYPTSSDDVTFDTSSSTANAAYTVTLVTATANCNALTMDGPDPADVNKVTWAGSVALNIYGNLNLSGGTAGITRTYTGAITFYGVGKTITTNGVVTASAIAFSGATASYTTVGAWDNGTGTFSSAQGGLTLGGNFTCGVIATLSGILNVVSYTVTCTSFAMTFGTLNLGSGTMTMSGNFNISDVTQAKIVNLGTGTINCSGFFNVSGTYYDESKLSLSASTSTINFSGNFQGGSGTYGTVNSTGATPNISGFNTFTNFTFTGTAAKTNTLTFLGDQIITGNLTINGNSAINRVIVGTSQSIIGDTIKLTVGGTVSVSNADFQDIEGLGAASWDLSGATGGSGDCQGNIGITFTTPVDQHWVGGGGDLNWSTAANWTSRVPLPQDNVFMDHAFGTSQTIVSDMPRMGKTIDWTGATWTTALTYTTTISQFIFGGFIGISGLTYTGTAQELVMAGRGTYSLNSNSLTIDQPVRILPVGGTYNLSGNFTVGSTRTLTILKGNFNTSGYVLSTGLLSIPAANYYFKTNINFGTETHLLTGVGTIISIVTGDYIGIADTNYTFKSTNTSSSAVSISIASRKVSNIWFDRGTSTGDISVTGDTIFKDFKDTGTVAHTIKFGTGARYGFDTFTVSGSSGKLITISSNNSGSVTYLFCKTGTINCDYLSIRDTLVGGGATWNAGVNSVFTNEGNHFGTGFGWNDAPASQKVRYWVTGGNGNWSSTTNWSLTSGGASGASVPNGRKVYFDANSGSGNVTIDTFSAIAGDIDCTGFTGNFVCTSNSNFITATGSVKFNASSTFASYTALSNPTYFFASGCSKNIDLQNCNTGLIFNGLPRLFTDNGYTNDTYTLQSNYTSQLGASIFKINISGSNFNANGYNITCDNVVASSPSSIYTINMGSGTWTVRGTGTVWDMTRQNLTLTPSTSTIRVAATSSTAKTFNGGALTYNNIVFEKIGSTTVNGSPTFNDINIPDNISATITLGVGSTLSFNTFTVSGRRSVQNSFTCTGGTAYLRPLNGSFSIDSSNITNIVSIGTGYLGIHSLVNTTNVNENIFNTAPSTVVSGNVKKGGVNVSGAIVRLVRQADNFEVGTTTTDGSGNYSFYADATKLYHIFVEYTDGGVKYNAKSLWNITPA